MAIRKVLGAARPSELIKHVDGNFITLTKGDVSVRVKLHDWNIYGLDCTL